MCVALRGELGAVRRRAVGARLGVLGRRQRMRVLERRPGARARRRLARASSFYLPTASPRLVGRENDVTSRVRIGMYGIKVQRENSNDTLGALWGHFFTFWIIRRPSPTRGYLLEAQQLTTFWIETVSCASNYENIYFWVETASPVTL
jgi:hypothetical protein